MNNVNGGAAGTRRHGLPPALARHRLGTLRPVDARAVYAHPRAQIARLVRNGDLHRLADGYYTVVPRDRVGGGWLPELEAAAAGIATAQFGEGAAVLMGVSACHDSLPAALRRDFGALTWDQVPPTSATPYPPCCEAHATAPA